MDGENTQKSPPYHKTVEDLIRIYKEDMEALPNEKKEKILDIFKNHKLLDWRTEFGKIGDNLHEACQKGDFEFVKVLLGKTIMNDSKDMSFKIDETNKTASLFKVNQNLEHVIVPRTVKYENNDYLITSVSSLGFSLNDSNSNIKTIKFAEDSAVKTFYNCAFAFSKVEEIQFPESLTDLKEGWCHVTSKLKKIIVSPSNDRFIFKDDKYLLGKSDNKSDEFDTLFFVRRDISEVSLPLNIKIIGSCSFFDSQISKVLIPASVTTICRSAFYNCRELQYVEFPENSNLQTIYENAFSNSSLEAISIPSSVSCICHDAFSVCRKLKKVEIPKDSNLKVIEKNTFYSSSVEEIFIPPSVKEIGVYAFADCGKLKKVEIPTNSNLQTIDLGAFIWTMIEEIYFPDSLIELKDNWCTVLTKLKKIIVSPSNNRFIFKDDKYLLGKSDNSSDDYDTLLFVRRDIDKVSLPSNIKIIGSSSCEFLSISDVTLPPNVKIIGPSSFASSEIKQIVIPSSVTKICENAFSGCKNLTKVEIPRNSNLDTIEERAFASSKIEEISLPGSVSKIGLAAFIQCYDLRKLSFAVNIKIEAIEPHLIEETNITEISIPQSVTTLCDEAFYGCKTLRRIEIPMNSNLKTIGKEAFSGTEIEELFLPEKLTELKEGWCLNANKLAKITVSPLNNQFKFFGDKYLLGKSENSGDQFDTLFFVPPDVKEIHLPPFVTNISSSLRKSIQDAK